MILKQTYLALMLIGIAGLAHAQWYPPPPPAYPPPPPVIIQQPAPQQPSVTVIQNNNPPPQPAQPEQPAQPQTPNSHTQQTPQSVVIQPAPQQPTYPQTHYPANNYPPPPTWPGPYRSPDMLWPRPGLRLNASGGFGSETRLWGASAAFRYRTSPTFGLDIGAGYMLGRDHLHRDHREIPIFLDGLLYLTPRQPIQLYLVAGAHVSWGHSEGVRRDSGMYDNADGFYLGGQGGLGIEFRINPNLYLALDARGTARHRMSGTGTHAFVEYDTQGRPTGRATNWSSRAVFNAGLIFYF